MDGDFRDGRGGAAGHRGEFGEGVRRPKPVEGAGAFQAGDSGGTWIAFAGLQLYCVQDSELLALHPDVGRPEDYIWQYISVPPPCIRQSVASESGK